MSDIKILNKRSIVLTDSYSGNQKRLSFDRIKVFHEMEVADFKQYYDDDDQYQMYYNRKRELLFNTNVKMRQKDVNLDYNNPSILVKKNQDQDQSNDNSNSNSND